MQNFPEQSKILGLKRAISSRQTPSTKYTIKLFLPSGSCRKRHIEEKSRLLNECIRDSPLIKISYKTIMLMPLLLSQKPSEDFKSKDHQLDLEGCLELSRKVELGKLYFQGETIQTSLKVIQKPSSIAEISNNLSNT